MRREPLFSPNVTQLRYRMTNLGLEAEEEGRRSSQLQYSDTPRHSRESLGFIFIENIYMRKNLQHSHESRGFIFIREYIYEKKTQWLTARAL